MGEESTPPPSDCTDLAPTNRCEELKGEGRCEQWKPFMEEKCSATCGFCNGGDDNEEDEDDDHEDDEDEDENPTTEDPETPTDDNDDELTEVFECDAENPGNCECGDTTEGITTYTFWVGDVQRCFTVFHPNSRASQKLPVVLSPNCYAQDRLQGISMTSATRGGNAAATKYGFSRIGLSTPDGHWTFGNDNVVNDDKPMPCSDNDSKDITYLKTVFEFIERYPDVFDSSRIYAEGFSQN